MGLPIRSSLRIRHILGCQSAAKLAEAVVPVTGRIGALEIFHREIVRSGVVRVFVCSSLTMTCGACAESRRPRASRTPKSRSHGSRSPDLPVESGFQSTCGRSEGPKEPCPLLGGAEKCDESLVEGEVELPPAAGRVRSPRVNGGSHRAVLAGHSCQAPGRRGGANGMRAVAASL